MFFAHTHTHMGDKQLQFPRSLYQKIGSISSRKVIITHVLLFVEVDVHLDASRCSLIESFPDTGVI